MGGFAVWKRQTGTRSVWWLFTLRPRFRQSTAETWIAAGVPRRYPSIGWCEDVIGPRVAIEDRAILRQSLPSLPDPTIDSQDSRRPRKFFLGDVDGRTPSLYHLKFPARWAVVAWQTGLRSTGGRPWQVIRAKPSASAWKPTITRSWIRARWRSSIRPNGPARSSTARFPLPTRIRALHGPVQSPRGQEGPSTVRDPHAQAADRHHAGGGQDDRGAE